MSCGFDRESVKVFEDMVKEEISPSIIRFVSVLGACSHAGLVDEGRRLFESMTNYNVSRRELWSSYRACTLNQALKSGARSLALAGFMVMLSTRRWLALVSLILNPEMLETTSSLLIFMLELSCQSKLLCLRS
jgi:pentatricopeptide repeat protein